MVRYPDYINFKEISPIPRRSRYSRLVKGARQGLGGCIVCKKEGNYTEGEFVAKSLGLGQELELLHKQYYDFIWRM